MSDVQTLQFETGKHTRVETLLDGTALKRPIRFLPFRSYVSIEDAEQMGRDLLAAARKARELAGET